ncbi:MAG: hypothetical protein LBH35_05070 [Treponema sp.]|jgi:hypothetical protein|nr:hypothetical protein [Treponema sp.]
MNGKRFLCIAAVLFCAGAVFAQDYGLVLRSLPLFTGGDDPVNMEYTASAVPWFAAPLGEQGDLYLSGGISAEYAGGEWKPVPELYRFEIEYRFASGPRLKAGRLAYREPLNLLMNGLFDGLGLSIGLGETRLSAGAFYTGLLYKKAAHIVLSPGDYSAYYDRGVYFASRRLAFALDWEIPAVAGTEAALNLGIAGQFDLNEPDDQIPGDRKIHSQYALAEYTLPFSDYYNARLGAIAGILEEDGRAPGFCFAVSGGLAWLPPGGVNDRLSLDISLSSGSWNDTMRAFLPLNTIAQGKVLRPAISGLALAELGYVARLHTVLSVEAWAAYFFRTDSHTYNDPDLDRFSRSPLLGGEVYGGLVWAPVSDISFTLGGGAFFPQLGKAFGPGAPVKWRVSLETIFSF